MKKKIKKKFVIPLKQKKWGNNNTAKILSKEVLEGNV